MLFKGAKKHSVSESADNLNVTPMSKDKMKQLFIGKDGSLLHSGTMVTTYTSKISNLSGKIEYKSGSFPHQKILVLLYPLSKSRIFVVL